MFGCLSPRYEQHRIVSLLLLLEEKGPDLPRLYTYWGIVWLRWVAEVLARSVSLVPEVPKCLLVSLVSLVSRCLLVSLAPHVPQVALRVLCPEHGLGFGGPVEVRALFCFLSRGGCPSLSNSLLVSFSWPNYKNGLLVGKNEIRTIHTRWQT